jgi:hypothetical protein
MCGVPSKTKTTSVGYAAQGRIFSSVVGISVVYASVEEYSKDDVEGLAV